MEQRLIPEQYRFLSGSALKLIAAVTMIIDHVAVSFLYNSMIVLFSAGSYRLTLYNLMRAIGRLSFPLFAFLLVEGFLHTHDKKRHGLRLAIFALLSELPWNLVHTGGLLYGKQNVFFTLLTGYLALCAVERFRGNVFMQCVCVFGLLIAAFNFEFDYSFYGFMLILLMYALRDLPVFRAAAGICLLPSNWKGGLAFVPIAFYNGKRGFIRGKALQFAFYAFYPVHLLVIWFIKYVVQA